MRISEVVEKLNAILEGYGDLKVKIDDRDMGDVLELSYVTIHEWVGELYVEVSS